MRTIGATELQRMSGAVMDEIKAGETVIVANHGRPAVAMVPVREYDELVEARRELKRLRHEGMGGMQ